MTPAPAKRIAIVGGGIAGVSTACELTRLARSSAAPGEVILFEASNRLGGIVETVRRDGFVVECGPDSWVTEKPWARELAVELGLEQQILSSNDAHRRTYILDDGKLVAMPDGMRMMVPTDLDALLGSPLFSAEARAAYAAEAGRAVELRTMAPDADESVSSFVRRHFGEEVAVKIAAPLLSGVFGGSIERLSVRSVMPAFVQMEREHGSLIVALQHSAIQRKSGRRKSGGDQPGIFSTLRTGLGTLIDSMADFMAAASPATAVRVAVRLNEPVLAIERNADRWLLKTAAGAEGFDAVVLATPAHVTCRMLAPINVRFGELLDFDASSAIVVALAFSAEPASTVRIPPGFGFLVPRRGLTGSPLLACTFVDQKFSHRVPPGAVLLRAFFGGDPALALLGQSDDLLAALAHRQLSAILGPLPDPAFTVVRRWPQSLPQYAVGHQARIAGLEGMVAELPGLHLAGNTYHGVGLPDLVRDGRALARKLLG